MSTPALSVVRESVPREAAALARLELLCDPGSLELLRTGVTSARAGLRSAPGDGVLAGIGDVEGRPVALYSQDVTHLGGSLGAAHAASIARVLELADRGGLPVVGFVESGGARLQEGLAALDGYGTIFRSLVALRGRVPVISVVCGPAAGGAAYAPALTDLVVMTSAGRMFLTGPGVVREAMGEDVDAEELGGPHVHDRNGVCDLVAADDEEAALLVRDLLGYLPSVAVGPLGQIGSEPAPPGEPAAILPSSPRQVYDVRSVARLLVDGGRLLELQPKRARNVVTALARVDGRAIGIVANQPRYLGGVLDANASHKAAAFIELCDRFGLPLVVLVDTPGFLPGTRQERAGVIDAGAALVRAFAAATVPSVTVVLRKAFGGAYIAMNSRPLGAGTTMAWQGAQVGVMSATQAVAIVSRRELAAADDPPRARRRLAARYGAEHLTAAGAAAGGHVDDVIAPSATRGRVVAALKALSRTTPGDRDR